MLIRFLYFLSRVPEVHVIPNCTDVFKVPLFSKRFCKAIIEDSELR